MRRVAIILAFMASILTLAGAPGAADAQGRVALVIGNSAYRHAAPLANPKNDAADVAAALRKLNFRVIEGVDLDKAAFDRKVAEFAGALRGASVGLFFYAGHGLQVGGQNYLVPVDAQADTAAALDFQMVRLDLVQRTMEREAQTNILFLDACRDNPLARNLARTMGTRSTDVGRGLAAAEFGRRHADQLLDPARQRGARRGRPQLALRRRARPTAVGLGRRSERHPDRRAQRRDDRDAAPPGAVGAFRPHGPLLLRRPTPGAAADARGAQCACRAPGAKRGRARLEPRQGHDQHRAARVVHRPLQGHLPCRPGEGAHRGAESQAGHGRHSPCATLPAAGRAARRCPGAAPGVLATPQVAPSSIPANPANRFGAIAYSPSTGSHGWSYDYASREEAERVALANCAQHARDCNVPIWFQNACGALAVGPSGYGSGWAINQGLAEAYALGVCGQHSASCSVRRWVCTTR